MCTPPKPLRLSLLGVGTLFFFLLVSWLVAPLPRAQVIRAETGNEVAAPTPTPGRVRGRVLYADTRRPVRHAGIYLVSLAEESTDEDEEDRPDIPDTVADLNGEFWFPKVPPGRYAAYPNDGGLAQLDNYLDSGLGLAERIRSGKLTDNFAEVTVKSGQESVVEIVARRSGAITGRILYADGSPVGRALVQVFRRREKGRLETVSGAATDARGIYRVAQLPAGEYIVAARDRDVWTNGPHDEKQAYSSGLFVAAYHPAARTQRKAAPVTVPEGQDAEGIDITLPDPQMHTISGLVTLKVAGQPPLIRVEISLARLEKEPGQPAQPSPLGGEGGDKYRTFSGVNGEWSISGVPDGLYQLRIEARQALLPGQAAQDMEEWSLGGSGALSTTQEVTVKGGDVSDLRLELVKGGALETVVTMSKGVPMPEYVSLRLVRVGAEAQKRQAGADDEEEEVEESTCPTSPEEPECVFNGLETGSYLLRAATDEIEGTPLYIKSATLKGQDLTRTPFKISAGQTIKGVQVVLSNQVASVRGKAWLERQGKKPAARQWVVLAPVEAVLRRAEDEPRRERTAGDGSFSFETVEPGEYFLFLPAPKVKLDEAFWRANAAKLPRLLLKPGAEIKDYEVFVP